MQLSAQQAAVTNVARSHQQLFSLPCVPSSPGPLRRFTADSPNVHAGLALLSKEGRLCLACLSLREYEGSAKQQ